VQKIIRVVKEVVRRTIALLDFVASLVGIRPVKYLRLQCYLCWDQKNNPVQSRAATDQLRLAAVDIFRREANVKIIRAFNYDVVDLTNVPEDFLSLNWSCSFRDSFSAPADFFRDHAENPVSTAGHESSSGAGWVADQLGYGEAISASVVRSMPSNDGCSFPVVEDFCVVEAGAGVTTLAHELGHMCGLPHLYGHNLMDPDGARTDTNLNRLQVSVLRTSRYVTYFRTGP